MASLGGGPGHLLPRDAAEGARHVAVAHVGRDAVEMEHVAALGREQRLPAPLLVALQTDGTHVLRDGKGRDGTGWDGMGGTWLTWYRRTVKLTLYTG